MAQSPTHKFGQIIGELVEKSLHDPLLKIAQRYKLYLDLNGDEVRASFKSKVEAIRFLTGLH